MKFDKIYDINYYSTIFRKVSSRYTGGINNRGKIFSEIELVMLKNLV